MSSGFKFNWKNLPIINDYDMIKRYGWGNYAGLKTFGNTKWSAIRQVGSSKSFDEAIDNLADVAPMLAQQYFIQTIRRG